MSGKMAVLVARVAVRGALAAAAMNTVSTRPSRRTDSFPASQDPKLLSDAVDGLLYKVEKDTRPPGK